MITMKRTTMALILVALLLLVSCKPAAPAQPAAPQDATITEADILVIEQGMPAEEELIINDDSADIEADLQALDELDQAQ